MADNLRIGYTSSAGVVYALDIYEFENETLPRQYIDNAAVDFTQLGSTFSTGPVGTQAKIWTVNTYLRNEITNNAQKNATPYNELRVLREMFDAWDLDRGNGLAARCALEDNLLNFGTTYTANVWFTSAPAIALAGSYGSKVASVVFGLTEVS